MRIAVLVLMLTAAAAGVPTCFITAPNIVHTDVEETVTIRLHGATEPVHMKLYFKFRGDQPISSVKTVTLNAQNNYNTLVKLKVERSLTEGLRTIEDIYLFAENKDLFEKGIKREHIILISRRGYIFIQSDKPIYNPRETVKFRIFTLDNYMLPVNQIINVRVFNSKGLVVYGHNFMSSQILERTITLPDVEPPGHWKITACFVDTLKFNTTVEFEVKEYVLPSFEVKIEAAQPYYILSDSSFQFSISARYTYGKGINGIAFVRFGVTDARGYRTYLPGLEKQASIAGGVANIQLLTTDLQQTAENRTITDLEGSFLYIAATVLEKASGDLEEMESSSVKIVTSPYMIDLSKTKQHFTPGGMFAVLATTTHPDGSRVGGLNMRAEITVELNGAEPESSTLNIVSSTEGRAVFTLQVPLQAKSLDVKVFVVGEEEKAHMTVSAVAATKSRHLSVEVEHRVLGPDESMTVTFRDIIPPGTTRPSHIYYMVLNKGRVVQMGDIRTSDPTTLSLPFSADMVPSFRLLGYYFTGDGLDAEIVADSVWVDVKDVCKGLVKIQPFDVHKPADVVNVNVQAERDSKVALVAVDTAVYTLNKKNKLTAQTMFDYMNSYDLGCSIGGGKDHKSVFFDAGLMFMCNCRVETKVRKGYSCSNPNPRLKRSYSSHFSTIVNRHSTEYRRCCSDGVQLNRMGLSCEQRYAKTADKPEKCRNVFLQCCKEATDLRRKLIKSRKYSIARSQGVNKEVEEAINEAAIHLRSYFPQSWMWMIKSTDHTGHLRQNVVVPDSITTWEVQAVGVSPTKGFCVAEPQQLNILQDFFVAVKLPYSVKRNEQLEIKVVVHNYKNENLEVSVVMDKSEGLCSAGEDRVTQKVTVPAQSAEAVYFTVVPLIIGTIPINIFAYASQNIADRIKKELRVEGEGEVTSIHKEYNINLKVDNWTLGIPTLPDMVPGERPDTYLSIRGGVMGESVVNCLNLEGINNLIQLPTGCAEQTMVTMSPAIHAMRFLDATNLWIELKAELRDEAKEMIQNGYNRILTFKKQDGSYGAFLKTPSSVWLTAFIAKELTSSRRIIKVEESYIKESISFLVSKQLPSGSFEDPNPLYDREMKGGIGKSDGDVPLTAFILVTMKHSLPLYGLGDTTMLMQAIEKARSYLEQKLDSLEKPYDLAITAYALSLTGPKSTVALRAQKKLRELAICDNSKNFDTTETDPCHWEKRGQTERDPKLQADSLSVETTAYALLQTLSEGDMKTGKRIVMWLTKQRKFGGGFQSTQDTVVALEALTEYSIKNSMMDDLDLTVELCFTNGQKKEVTITKHNALTQDAIKITETRSIAVNLRGTGEGTLSLVQNYRSLKKPDLYCNYFSLKVTLEGELAYLENADTDESFDDYYNYEDGEGDGDVHKDEAMTPVEWFDLRSRRKRQAPEEQAREDLLVYTVCLGMKNGTSKGMVIVDITLLSGLEPNIQDLEVNVKGTEKYIDHYDVGLNKVYLYFREISSEEQCLQFRAKQIVPIGLVQPAAAVIYDYYNPERRCGMFYSAPQKSRMLTKLCQGDVCSCAEGLCPKIRVTFSLNMKENTRSDFACFYPVVDFVYVITVLSESEDGVFKFYTTRMNKVLLAGKEEGITHGATREMIVRKSCSDLDLKPNGEYLFMGKNEAVLTTPDANRNFRYILNNNVWLELIPEERRCRATKSRAACEMLQNFLGQFELNKCTF
ncbi:complement C4-A [Denticeps clupeoides]|uniref:Complement C4 gamma chain n=1 Tax=Denticeps clupeoides TaxID=299321 RepID=A0AAY4EXN7_9TELE|nr:complement C4-A-like [Denticeps clupeoides]